MCLVLIRSTFFSLQVLNIPAIPSTKLLCEFRLGVAMKEIDFWISLIIFLYLRKIKNHDNQDAFDSNT